MNSMISAIALAAALSLSGAAMAQGIPSNTADAKGNAPLKHAHTVNDGGAKKGATSFTETEARNHIVHAGYESVTGLTKGKDGVWRGVAMKGGVPLNVGLDFKGNVSEGGPANVSGAATTSATAHTDTSTGMTRTETSTAMTAGAASASKAAMASHRRRHHRHTACKTPGPNGVACSGVDRNENGISDKEDHAIKAGARP